MSELTEIQELVLHKIALTSVGFMVLDDFNEEHRAFKPAGSGVLCRLPNRKLVILTAAHVIENLMKYEKAAVYGIPSIHPDPRPYEFLTKDAHAISFWEKTNLPQGPDIAVVKLPYEIDEWLESARNPHDLGNRIDDLEDKIYTDHALVGLPSTAYSRFVSLVGNTKRDEHTLIVASGTLSVSQTDAEGFDTFEYRSSPDGATPVTYEGVSGGGIWMFNGDDATVRPILKGIAFYQSEMDEEGRRVIYCNGLKSVYDKALGKALDDWS